MSAEKSEVPHKRYPVPSSPFRGAVYVRKEHEWVMQAHGQLQCCIDDFRIEIKWTYRHKLKDQSVAFEAKDGVRYAISFKTPQEAQSCFESLENIKEALKDDRIIDFSSIKKGAILGTGEFGDVFQAEMEERFVAVKELKVQPSNQEAIKAFATEIDIMGIVNNPFVVKMWGYCVAPFAIVMEYLPNGSLWRYIHRHSKRLDLDLILQLSMNIARGMECLHDAQIVHRDLKSPNILLDQEMRGKVSDFGLSKILSGDSEMTRGRGTVHWMAPEVLVGSEYSNEVDVYSFGIILFEMLAREVPYKDIFEDSMAICNRVLKGGRPEPIPPGANPVLVKLMKRCWDGNPSVRPTFKQIIIELGALMQPPPPMQTQPSPSSTYIPPGQYAPYPSTHMIPPPPVVSTIQQPQLNFTSTATSATTGTYTPQPQLSFPQQPSSVPQPRLNFGGSQIPPPRPVQVTPSPPLPVYTPHPSQQQQQQQYPGQPQQFHQQEQQYYQQPPSLQFQQQQQPMYQQASTIPPPPLFAPSPSYQSQPIAPLQVHQMPTYTPSHTQQGHTHTQSIPVYQTSAPSQGSGTTQSSNQSYQIPPQQPPPRSIAPDAYYQQQQLQQQQQQQQLAMPQISFGSTGYGSQTGGPPLMHSSEVPFAFNLTPGQYLVNHPSPHGAIPPPPPIFDNPQTPPKPATPVTVRAVVFTPQTASPVRPDNDYAVFSRPEYPGEHTPSLYADNADMVRSERAPSPVDKKIAMQAHTSPMNAVRRDSQVSPSQLSLPPGRSPPISPAPAPAFSFSSSRSLAPSTDAPSNLHKVHTDDDELDHLVTDTRAHDRSSTTATAIHAIASQLEKMKHTGT